ncbi:carboxymuconolactone decarboxylase family protein [Cupriavidus gilardii]|uniref:carboxymuconolactone decarboxylase family protein n=1 Tax=Cupriavidus gilardii TaxID=82541 RepID=UPI001EE601C3|nr:carboxymuconolactone decarboxylase family protein [Cupriavidus gilardii]MCG5258591.1 carboxymuconolactone decarboxylase family protein [Cupriavidus gilardii]MDF9431706.1 carboxymuconolactone decarboxylase family protein [Cupriavidus gilardii]
MPVRHRFAFLARLRSVDPALVLAAVYVSATFGAAYAQGVAGNEPAQRTPRERGNATMDKLSGGAGQPVLNALRKDFPPLADAIVDYSLGDVWSRPGLDDRTRQLAAVAAFAAQGHTQVLKIHAGYALRLGVTPEELKEVVYLTTVTAGFPRAIDAANAVREVLQATGQGNAGAAPR